MLTYAPGALPAYPLNMGLSVRQNWAGRIDENDKSLAFTEIRDPIRPTRSPVAILTTSSRFRSSPHVKCNIYSSMNQDRNWVLKWAYTVNVPEHR